MISPTSNVAASSGGLGLSLSAPDQLSTDFLQLLITQLKNQDPFSPLDSAQMVEQLATLTNLEQLQGVNDRLDQSLLFDQAMGNSLLMGLVGKRVTVSGDAIRIQEGEPSRTLLRTVEDGVGRAEVRDAAGNVVRVLEGIQVKSGFTVVEWDGKSDSGDTLADGTYTISVTVTGSDGPVDAALFQSGIVETIQFDGSTSRILVNGREYAPGDIVEVGLPGTGSDSAS